MLKKSSLRRIIVSTIALIITSILYFFPTEENPTLTKNIEYVSVNNVPIYLLNPDNYVVRTNIAIDNTDSLKQAQELISALTIGSSKTEYISDHFTQIIPQNTKVLDISLEDGLLKINFSKEILNIAKDMEEKLIESLVYTLTEIKGIEEIMIFIESTKLEVLPQSNIKLPNTLDRSYGINKVYDITNIKNSTKTTVYYIGEFNDLVYYIPVTKIDNSQENKIEIIIDELKSSPIYETNLMSYLASSVELENYEELENQIILSFNNAIFDDFTEQNILEEVKYSISLSLKDTLGIQEVIFKVGDKVVETLKEI